MRDMTKLENFREILAKYDFRDRDGKSIGDYPQFVNVLENERNIFDEHGHPLTNCREFREIRDIWRNAAHLSDEPVHNFFGLSYSSYLVLRRSVLQSAPVPWQQRFIKLLDELQEMFDDEYLDGEYVVQIRDERGKFVGDGNADYERGRRVIPFKTNGGDT